MGVRVPISSIGLTLLFFLLPPSHGLFTQTTCWNGECVQQKETGTWCYVPKSGETALLDCKGAQSDLQAVMNVHLTQDLSIAYYNGVDNSRFGGASWPVPANGGVVRLCVSGYAGDGTLQTLCTNVGADNSITGSPYCEIEDGPHVVSDGCYTFRPTLTPLIQTTTNPPPLPSSTSSSSTTTTHTSTSSTTTSSLRSPSPSPSPSPSSSSSSSSSLLSSSTPSPSSTATSSNSNSNSSNAANNMRDIGVPIIVAVLGVVAAYVGARKWGQRRNRNQNAAAAANAQQQQVDQQPMQQQNPPPPRPRRAFYGPGNYSDGSSV